MNEERYADKIAKLLRKAEDPGATPEESASFTSKAQELMTEYAIDEELLAVAKGEVNRKQEKVTRESIVVSGVYVKPFTDILIAIARHNDCRPIYGYSGKRGHEKLLINGFESDVRRVIMLNSSLQVQAVAALGAWWKQENADGLAPRGKHAHYAKRGFLRAFARGLDTQLVAARAKGEEAAAKNEEERGKSAEDAKAGVALAIRSKKERVDEWIDETYGNLGTKRAGHLTGGTYSGTQAGFAAGRNADASTGSSGVPAGGSRGALNR
jgi:hypothetical protein